MNVTYLFGAGASANKLPVVEGFNGRFNSFINELAMGVKGNNPELIADMQRLAKQAPKYGTIDTYARILGQKGETNELLRLRFYLSLFFTWEQQKMGVDYRYYGFVSKIFKAEAGTLSLPLNLRILSWNYDSQIELAASEILSCDVRKARINLMTMPSITGVNYAPSKLGGFHFYKLNGSADLMVRKDGSIRELLFVNRDNISDFIKGDNPEFYNDFKLKILERVGWVLSHVNLDFMENEPLLAYAWEEVKSLQVERPRAMESVSETDTLIIIGYSFPDYNRSIDEEVIRGMSKLRKIYVQAPSDGLEEIVERVSTIIEGNPNIEILSKTNVREFYVPPVRWVYS